MTASERTALSPNVRWPGVQLGPQWSSFEKLRLDQDKNEKLAQLGGGRVGELRLKGGREIMLVEKRDFQALVAAAREIDRLRGGVRVIVGAAHLVRRHPDSDTVSHLIEAVMALGESPALPVRDGHAPLDLPEQEMGDDEFLDPAEAQRLAKWTER